MKRFSPASLSQVDCTQNPRISCASWRRSRLQCQLSRVWRSQSSSPEWNGKLPETLSSRTTCFPCHQHCLSKWGELELEEEVLEGKHGNVDFHNRRNRFGYTWDSFSCTVKLFEVYECRMYLTFVTLPTPVSSDFLNICSSSLDLLGLRNTDAGLSHIANSTLELPCVQVQKATNTSCALNQAGDKYFSGGGGPCHYLFSKEEPLSQIHWSSGLYKLIATGPKPSVMLNLLPSTRALGELCNLVWSNRRLTWSPWAHFHQSQVETPHGSCSIFWGMQSPIKSSSLLVSG